jgi:purine-binding chemotaxis protein CheW
MRRRLGLGVREAGANSMSVVVEHSGELFSLMVDSVGEVLSLADDAFESNPPTISASWREISLGVYRLEGRLLVILDVPRVIDSKRSEAA